jgi:LacI family transcriptional regulator
MKEIALQAALGLATVDRVLNGWEHVRQHTRQRVQHAIKELEKQQFQLATSGRKLVVDVVVEAPRRFSDEIREALELELPRLHPAVFRPRFLMQDTMTTAEVVDALKAIGRRGNHGVLLKARDVPEFADAIAELQQRQFSSDMASQVVRLVATHRHPGRFMCLAPVINRQHGRNGMFENKL